MERRWWHGFVPKKPRLLLPSLERYHELIKRIDQDNKDYKDYIDYKKNVNLEEDIKLFALLLYTLLFQKELGDAYCSPINKNYARWKACAILDASVALNRAYPYMQRNVAVAVTLMLNECAIRSMQELFLTSEESCQVLAVCCRRIFLLARCSDEWKAILLERVSRLGYGCGNTLSGAGEEIIDTQDETVYETQIATILASAKRRLEVRLCHFLDSVLISDLATLVVLYAVRGYSS